MKPAVSPTTADLRFTVRAMDPAIIGAEELSAFIYILVHCAACSVWTYSPPAEPCVEDDDKILARIAGMTPKKWKKAKREVMRMFVLVDGYWYPEDGLFEVVGGGTARPPIPGSIRMAVMKRDGFTCGYCVATDGPFDLDHIIPLSRGGHPTAEDNLMCSCAACNRRKSAMTPEEWVR